MKRTVFAAVLTGFTTLGAVNWDDALVTGRTNGDKCFYAAGEEMVFTLELKGVKGEIPPGEYFLDWIRTADDGKVEKGCVPAACGKPLVIRTSLDRPGFVKIEANLVDKTGKRVPKKHRWEKRVFFQGGAGVEIGKLQAWPEPEDFDAHWAAERKIVDDLPLKVLERTKIPCQNKDLDLWRMKLNVPEGYRPAIGYLVIPKKASASNRLKATGMLSGYYNFAERCPAWLTNRVDGLAMYINRHGCEVDREESYYRPFYGKRPFPPDHFRGMAFRAMQMFRYLKTLPEWNGKDLIAYGTSGGGMQTFWMGVLVPGLSRIECSTPALADVFGFKYGRASSGLGARVEEINYYDICNFAKRVTCPVTINAGLGDYTCPPGGIAIVYNNLKGRKRITWNQGCTHGWWPGGMKKVTFSADAQVADTADLARRVAEDVAKPVRPAGVTPAEMTNIYETVKTPYKMGMVLKPEKGEMIDNPMVYRHDGVWYMMFIRFDGKGYETHLATSDDLVRWRRLGCVLRRGAEGAWDAAQADGWPALFDPRWDGPNTLNSFRGKYWMMYLGGNLNGYETDPLSTGVAWTDDPSAVKLWTRYEGNPVLRPSDPDAREFEKKTIYKHYTVDDPSRSCGGRFVNFYNAKQRGVWREMIGMAVSDDMLRWRRVGDRPVIENGDPLKDNISGDPMIRRIGDLWVMFYFGYKWKPGVEGAFDTFACSRDLRNWTKWDGEPLVKPSEPYDRQHAHKPWVLKHDGVVYHYYCAVGTEGRGIALAVSAADRVEKQLDGRVGPSRRRPK